MYSSKILVNKDNSFGSRPVQVCANCYGELDTTVSSKCPYCAAKFFDEIMTEAETVEYREVEDDIGGETEK